MMESLTLEIITPEGRVERVYCDSAQLPLADDQKGRGKGSYGIRRGHAEAVLLLARGITRAEREGKELFRAKTGRGFATVKDDVISVVVESAERIEVGKEQPLETKQ